MPNPEKKLQRIEQLETELIRLLECTGLVIEARIGGDLTNKQDPLYLEYRLKDNNKREQRIVGLIRDKISLKLTLNHHEVLAVEKAYDGDTGVRREQVVLRPKAKIGDGLDLKYSLLKDMEKEISNYMMRA